VKKNHQLNLQSHDPREEGKEENRSLVPKEPTIPRLDSIYNLAVGKDTHSK